MNKLIENLNLLGLPISQEWVFFMKPINAHHPSANLNTFKQFVKQLLLDGKIEHTFDTFKSKFLSSRV